MVTKYQKFADGYKAEAVEALPGIKSDYRGDGPESMGLKESTLANWVKKARIMRRSRWVRHR